ncbi:MAG: gas vesicle protein [Planctomycetales bacterium]|nr:gas vesicle protein [Planctomycetales bacterium]
MKRTEPARPNMNGIPQGASCGDDSLLELLDRLLNTGVVLVGDVNISVADIELICLRLQVVLSSAETARENGWLVPTREFYPAAL